MVIVKQSSIWWSCEEGNRGQDTRYHNGGTGVCLLSKLPFQLVNGAVMIIPSHLYSSQKKILGK